MFDKLKISWAKKIIRKARLKEWKEEKRKKWLAEGRTAQEVEERLKVYK